MTDYTYNYKVNPIKRFLKLLEPDTNQVINIYIYAIFSGIVSLSLPLGIQAIINFIMGGQISVSWIVLVGLVIIGVFLSGLLQVFQLIITENIEQKIFAKASFEFTYRLPRLDYESISNMFLPEMVNRFFDTLSVQKGLGKLLIDFSTYSIQILFGLILLSFYHPFFIAFSLMLLGVIFLIFRITGPKGLITGLKESKYKYELAHWLEEIAHNMETFKMAGKSDYTMERTDEVTKKYIEARKKHFGVLLLQYYHMVGFKVLIVGGLLIIGGILVIDQQMNIGQFVASEIVILLIMGATEKLILNIDTIYDVLIALEKIGNVTDIPLENSSKNEKIVNNKDENGINVKLNNVEFVRREKAHKLLDNVNLDIKAGEKWCIVGPSDAGKSLLLKVISGFFEDYEGNILINGIPLRNLSYENLRGKIGNAANTEGVFMGTVLENITLGRKNVSVEDVQKAASLTGLADEIALIRNGYEHQIDYGVHPLPKEIIEKIIWTRALAGNPKLLLYDDIATTGSNAQKNAFWKLITDKDFPCTVIAISNQLPFINMCDYAVLMEKGKVIKTLAGNKVNDDEWFINNCSK